VIEAELQKFLSEAISQGEDSVEVSDLLEAEVLVVHHDPMIHELIISAGKQIGSGFNIALHHATSIEAGLEVAKSRPSLAALYIELRGATNLSASLESLSESCPRLQQIVAIVASDAELSELSSVDGDMRLPSLRESVTPSQFIDGCHAFLHELKLRFNLLQSFRDARALLSEATDLASLHRMISSCVAQLASFFEVDALLIADLKNPASETTARMTRTEGIHEILRRAARLEQEQLSRSQAAELRLLANLVGTEHVVEALEDESSTLRLEDFKATVFEGCDLQIAFAYAMQDSLVSAFAIATQPGRRDLRMLQTELMNLFRAWALRHEHLTMRTLKERLAEDELQVRQSLNAAITEMVCGVAHEINTPLGIIRTAVSIVTDAISSDEAEGLDEDLLDDLKSSSTMIESNVQRLSELVERFKTIALSQTPEKASIHFVSDPIERAVKRIRTAHPGLIINKIFELDHGSDEWLGYPQRLEEVVFQLLENANYHAYDDKGGMIELRLRGRVLGSQPRYSLEVTDFGKGISRDNLRRIYDAFFTTSRMSRSTGLGLAMVKSIVEEALGGKIRCRSAPNEGTSFSLDFQSLSEEEADDD
jgi:signal transduction histidine kinase